MEPKRKLLKKKLSPKEATTFSKICSLGTDNVSNRNSWASIEEKSIYICVQKRGHPSDSAVNLSRKEFERIVEWYIKKQKTYL